MIDEIFTEINNAGIKDIALEEDGALKYIVANDKNLHSIVKFLKEKGYEHLSFVTAVDKLNELEVVYLLHSYAQKNFIPIKVKLGNKAKTGEAESKTEILISPAEIIAEGINDYGLCLGCGLCNKVCVNGVDVKSVIFGLKQNKNINPEQISNCAICGLCQEKCPKKIKILEVFKAINKIKADKTKTEHKEEHKETKETESIENEFVIPTLTEIFKSADWHERETFDMFGINFEGHKNLRRILLPAEFKGYPLLKSYPCNKEQEISLSSDFEATKDELTVDKFIESEGQEGRTYQTKIMHLNVGPHHPSTHGVLRLRMIIDGERMIKIEPVIGYLHRGIEKVCESLNYNQIVPYMDRLDYVASMLNEFPYVLAMEKLMNIEIPERAQIIRVIVAELNRIASHIVWFTTWCMDLGATTPFFYGFNDREKILEIFEDVSRARMMFNYMCVGGVKKDINESIAKKIYKFIDMMPAHMKEYHNLITGNEIFLARTKNIGILKKEDAINFGVTGPMLRASGVNYDVRKDEPYSMYAQFKFNVPVFNEGDNFSRYMVRMNEIEESLKIIKQGMDILNSVKEGEIIAKVPRMIIPPKGSVYEKIEHAKGEMGIFIVSDGKPKPYRLKIRSPSFSNLSALPKMCENNYVADVVAISGTIDPVMGCVDR